MAVLGDIFVVCKLKLFRKLLSITVVFWDRPSIWQYFRFDRHLFLWTENGTAHFRDREYSHIFSLESALCCDFIGFRNNLDWNWTKAEAIGVSPRC